MYSAYISIEHGMWYTQGLSGYSFYTTLSSQGLFVWRTMMIRLRAASAKPDSRPARTPCTRYRWLVSSWARTITSTWSNLLNRYGSLLYVLHWRDPLPIPFLRCQLLEHTCFLIQRLITVPKQLEHFLDVFEHVHKKSYFEEHGVIVHCGTTSLANLS